jgi:glycosyltransferase involved in cell wall biosynthesis
MLNSQRITVVMPAYNAEKTLVQTFAEIPRDIVDEVILTDDGSRDGTSQLARDLGITTYIHHKNRGYGRNQKTCYSHAIRTGANIVIMVHPDYQYTPKLITAMTSLIAYDVYDVVLGSRILGKSALAGGMPAYKYVCNRLLTFIQNIALGLKLSEYHTGYRAFSRRVLEHLPLEENSDDFVFDNQMLTQIAFFGYRIGEVSCPARYFKEASSIDFPRSVKYGLGCLLDSLLYILAKLKIFTPSFLSVNGRRLDSSSTRVSCDIGPST